MASMLHLDPSNRPNVELAQASVAADRRLGMLQRKIALKQAAASSPRSYGTETERRAYDSGRMAQARATNDYGTAASPRQRHGTTHVPMKLVSDSARL